MKINDGLLQNRSFYTNSFNYNFSGFTSGPFDVRFDLFISYPQSILIIDDRVEVSGKAVLLTPKCQRLDTLAISFQNAIAYPMENDSDGLTKGGALFFHRTQNNGRWEGKTAMVWTSEGLYYPRMQVILINATDKSKYDRYPTIFSDDVAITVNSKAQISQIMTNAAMLYLTIMIFFLTFVELIPGLSTLWNKNQPQNDNNDCQTNTKNKTYIKNNMSHFVIKHHANQNTHYHYRTRYKK